MAFDFPNSPTNGQVFTPAGGPTYTYDLAGTKWTVTGTGLSGLTTASQTDAVTGTSTSVAMTPNSTAALWAKGASITLAANLIIPVTGSYFHVTGTGTPITDIDFTSSADGRHVWLVFDSPGVVLTHNVTTLRLPGLSDITTQTGDMALFVQDASDNVICLSYTRLTGSSVITVNSGVHTSGTAANVNITSATSYAANWYRVGDTVTMAGRVDIDPVAADTVASFFMSCPLAPTTFADQQKAAGVFAAIGTKGQAGAIYSETGTTNVRFEFIPVVATLQVHEYTFTYKVA